MAMLYGEQAQIYDVARRRLHGLDNAEIVLADITALNLGRLFDGGVCPINTLLT